MSLSAKGFKTKQSIFTVAKKIFYEIGYTKATVKEICEKANVKLGTFTYYYATKDELINGVYADLLMNSYIFVNKHSEKKLNSLEKNALATIIYYKTIFRDQKTVRFHHEVILNKSVYDYMFQNTPRIYRQFVKDLNLDIDEEELKRLSSADSGIRRELGLQCIEKKLKLSSTELATTIISYMGRLFRIDDALMSQCIEEAIEFDKKHDSSHIRLLI